MDDLKLVLAATYCHSQWTVDQLASSQDARDQFRSILPSEHCQISNDDLIRELLSLRKAGHLSRKNRQRAKA